MYIRGVGYHLAEFNLSLLAFYYKIVLLLAGHFFYLRYFPHPKLLLSTSCAGVHFLVELLKILCQMFLIILSRYFEYFEINKTPILCSKMFTIQSCKTFDDLKSCSYTFLQAIKATLMYMKYMHHVYVCLSPVIIIFFLDQNLRQIFLLIYECTYFHTSQLVWYYLWGGTCVLKNNVSYIIFKNFHFSIRYEM